MEDCIGYLPPNIHLCELEVELVEFEVLANDQNSINLAVMRRAYGKLPLLVSVLSIDLINILDTTKQS